MNVIIEIIHKDIMLAACIAVALGFITDYVWCKWMQSVQKQKPFYAANWSLTIGVFSLVYTLAIVANEVMPVLGYLMGCYCGTFVATKYGNENESK